MFQRRRVRILLALLVVSAIALVTLDVRSDDDGLLPRARDGGTVLLRPIQEGVSALISPLTGLGETVSDLVRTRSENQRLREEVASLQQRRRLMSDLERENEELRGLVAISERTELETRAARVVSLAPSNFEWTVTIDLGRGDGVERGMPVIDGDGLVGRVIQVTDRASRVLLAIDPSFSAAARTADTGEVGMLDGRGGDPMTLRLLDTQAEVEVGERVVTSAYQGGVFPAGIPIGTVTAVVDGISPLNREIQVNPFVDFTRLHHVLVVYTEPVENLPPFEGGDELGFERPPLPSLGEDGAGEDDETGGQDDGADEQDDGADEQDDGEPSAWAPPQVGARP